VLRNPTDKIMARRLGVVNILNTIVGCRNLRQITPVAAVGAFLSKVIIAKVIARGVYFGFCLLNFEWRHLGRNLTYLGLAHENFVCSHALYL